MITGAVVGALLACLDALLSLMPTFSLPDSEAYHGHLSWVYDVGQLLPVQVVMSMLLIALAVELALRLWDVAVFVYHQFWGSN